ncbi:MAG TPA: hypothetical protein VE570_12675 [Thermoleophilaceae bacterium]|jgi:hypothetical protein|nr:hypothetical protein [Thermoleophilaceae bacterium]
MERLAAADPARGTAIDERRRAQLWAVVAATAREPRPQRRTWPRLRRRSAFFALAGAIAVTTGALAATEAIRFGEPAKSTGAFSNPHRGAGSILPHSVRMLPISVPDPDGGPRWGMRILSTTRGVGCIQVGRLLRGRLGLLGRDGAFKNDGRFHPLPPTADASPGGCSALDANGRIFWTVGVDYIAASGTNSCFMQSFFRGGAPPEPACDISSMRTLSYGLLGPNARSVTYKVGGRTLTQRTHGPEGAYLIVIPAIRQSRSDAVRPALLPWGGPVTAIDYAGGLRCNLPPRGRPYPAGACKPQGYVAPAVQKPTRRDVASPVHARLVRSHSGRRSRIVQVNFTARIAVTSTRSLYTIGWTTTAGPKETHIEMTQRDLKAGATVRKRFAVRKPGVVHGTVRYVSSDGPAGGIPIHRPGDGVLVGRFAIRVP